MTGKRMNPKTLSPPVSRAVLGDTVRHPLRLVFARCLVGRSVCFYRHFLRTRGSSLCSWCQITARISPSNMQRYGRKSYLTTSVVQEL